MTSLRPDEMARESEIRKARGRTNEVRSGLQAVSSIGTAGLTATAATKILPFINQYISPDLALKGINKIMPEVGNFLKNGMKQGLTLQSGLDFLKENIGQKTQKESEKPPEQSQVKQQNTNKRNVIASQFPELHSFLENEILNGRPPQEALSKAKSIHGKSISKLEKQLGAIGLKLPDLVDELYGQYGLASSNPGLAQEAPQQSQPSQQGNPQAKEQLLQAMQALSNKLRT